MSMRNDNEEDSISQMSDGDDADAMGPSTCSNTKGSSSSADKKVKFVQRESLYVLCLRILVLLVLLLSAAALCLMMWLISSNGESDSFDSSYTASSEKIAASFMQIATDDMGVAGSLAAAAIAEGKQESDKGQVSWPFVTMPAFQERATTIMKLSGSLYIGMIPLVHNSLREEWEEYSTVGPDVGWYQEGIEYQELLGFNFLDSRPQIQADDPTLNMCCGIANHIYDYDLNNQSKARISPLDDPYYLPLWQTCPVTKRTRVNQNGAANSKGAVSCLEKKQVVFESMQTASPGYQTDPSPTTSEIASLLTMTDRRETWYGGDPYTSVFFPLYDNFSTNRTAVGVMRIVIHWARYFQNVLPDSDRGIIVVLENSCDKPFTYQINGGKVVPMGSGDLHDQNFNHYEVNATFRSVDAIEDGTAQGMILFQDQCPYSVRIYPSTTYYNSYYTNTPFVTTFSAACVFVFTVFMFFVYDRLVERRQVILMQKATETHKIVASLFPKNVRDRMLQEGYDKEGGGFTGPNHHRLKSFLNGSEDENNNMKHVGQAPIADLFPQATVLFTDIAGFTAWSSSREPGQVFILLQSVYQAFDHIAKHRKVFKVETIGDSYVAVTGVPEPQPNHAVIMARFASECMFKMAEVVRELESNLGPDTGDLSMRFGINSGPVTAGVLRGERSRFQLFGDTMNTASRMESTGVPGKIQATRATADLLVNAGKAHWVIPREDNVLAKGKGVLQTYWVTPHATKGTSNGSSESVSCDNTKETTDSQGMDTNADALIKHERHIDWMVELLQESIRLIIAKRQTQPRAGDIPLVPTGESGHIWLDEVVEAIKLPDFDPKAADVNANSVKIDDDVVADLRAYVAIIASAYRDNPFHNFDHACHVTMCANKFLKRIVRPEMEMDDLSPIKDESKLAKMIASHLHDYTHGINSDPITIFAIVFSALIHDVDHRGVSNIQLMKEEPPMADMFRNKSIAEQNSLDLSWNLLMSDRFDKLRGYIFGNNESLLRFRQVVVNVVLATDIFDKELNNLRKERWEKAFSQTSGMTKEKNALRATIVLEHIIQASDVCHTMQHWHIYRKWSQQLFFEQMKAYVAGRMGVDPASFWYSGELSFFDNYIIPLANKLKECNVFGVSSDECLNYAMMNRAEWEARGELIVAEMVAAFHSTDLGRFFEL